MKTKTTLNSLLVLLFVLLFTGQALKAQKLWGPAFVGGANNNGTLVQMNMDGSGFTKFYDFDQQTGSNPIGGLVQADNGRVYGICLNGGPRESCVIYSVDVATANYVMEWSFDYNGNVPASGLVKGPNGILYGVATMGGVSDAGVIYTWNTGTQVYTDVYDFSVYSNQWFPYLDSVSGYAPVGSPVLASDGKLYGLASGFNLYYQATQGFGNIYSFDINSNTYTDLHKFDGVHDGFGFGSMVEHNGVLYGMTSGRPQYAPGLISYTSGWQVPSSPLPAANSGNIFSFDPAKQKYTDLYHFDTVNGLAPCGSLYMAKDGKFYGVTSAGGANNLGVIFSFDPVAKTYTKLYDFNGVFGAAPMSDLMQSTDGYLFGSTSAGGANGNGVVYRFDPVTQDLTVLYSYESAETGASPLGGAFAVVNPVATGILAPANKQSLSVYPVPAHNSVNVSIESAAGQSVLFTLTDVNGQTIWGPKTEPVNGNSQIQLDLSALESGVYFLRASAGDNVMIKKIVRQ